MGFSSTGTALPGGVLVATAAVGDGSPDIVAVTAVEGDSVATITVGLPAVVGAAVATASPPPPLQETVLMPATITAIQGTLLIIGDEHDLACSYPGVLVSETTSSIVSVRSVHRAAAIVKVRALRPSESASTPLPLH